MIITQKVYIWMVVTFTESYIESIILGVHILGVRYFLSQCAFREN